MSLHEVAAHLTAQDDEGPLSEWARTLNAQVDAQAGWSNRNRPAHALSLRDQLTANLRSARRITACVQEVQLKVGEIASRNPGSYGASGRVHHPAYSSHGYSDPGGPAAAQSVAASRTRRRAGNCELVAWHARPSARAAVV